MKSVPLGELMPSRIPGIDPQQHPAKLFTLWSIPSFDAGAPVPTYGRDIGSNKKLVQPGDVILSKIVPHIRRAWTVQANDNNVQIASSEWIIFRDCRFLSDYVRHFLLSDVFHQQFMGTVAGVGGSLLRAQPQSVAKIVIPLPPIEEQARIVALLDRAAAIRRRAEATREKARSILPALFVDMFGDPLRNPKGWDVVELGKVADVSSGITKGRKLKDTAVFQAPYMRVANVQDGRLDLTEIKTIDAVDRDFDRYRLEEGDLLMTEGGDPDKLGRCAIWGNEVHNCLHQNHVFRVRMKREQVLPTYAATLIGSAYGKSYFLKVAKRTTGIASINKTQLSAFPVLLPPIAMQQEFDKAADAAKKLENRIAAAEAKSAKVLAAISAEVFA